MNQQGCFNQTSGNDYSEITLAYNGKLTTINQMVTNGLQWLDQPVTTLSMAGDPLVIKVNASKYDQLAIRVALTISIVDEL